MIIRGKVVAKIQQEGGASFARIQVYKKKKTAAALMRIFDILDDGELNIGDQVVVEVHREVIKQYEPPFESAPGCMFHSAPEKPPFRLLPEELQKVRETVEANSFGQQEHDTIMREITRG